MIIITKNVKWTDFEDIEYFLNVLIRQKFMVHLTASQKFRTMNVYEDITYLCVNLDFNIFFFSITLSSLIFIFLIK